MGEKEDELKRLKGLLQEITSLNENWESSANLTAQQFKKAGQSLAKYKAEYEKLGETTSDHAKALDAQIVSLKKNIDGAGNVWNYLGGQIKGSVEELDFFIKNSSQIYLYGEKIAESYLGLNKSIGLTGNKSKEVRQNFKDALPEVLRLGGSAEDLKNTWTEFSEKSGRQNILSADDLQNMVAFQNATDMSAGESARLYENFSFLGVSISDAHEVLNDVFTTSNKMGLNSGKVLKVLSQNMQKMQSYSFKGGVKAMTEMAKMSVKMRMEVADMLGMADKFYNPEQAIEAAAQLQLMGGDIAEAFGDPFETMYLARNKPEELAKKLQDMTENMLEFNKETGSYDLPAEARQQLEFAAEQLGQSKESMIELAIQSSKIKDLKMNVSGNIMDNDMRETIAGMAQMKDGKWSVDIAGESIPIEDITDEQAKKIAASPESTLQDQAKATMSNTQANDANTEAMKAETVRLVQLYESISALKPAFNTINEALGKAVGKVKDSDTGKVLSDTSFAEKMGEDINKLLGNELGDLGDIFGGAIDKLDESLGDFIKELNPNNLSKGGVMAGGGRLVGASHDDGGIPFSVNGVPGFEAENNEIVLTKGVYEDPVKRNIASSLNTSEGGKSFATGGGINASDLTSQSEKITKEFQGVMINGNMTNDVTGKIEFGNITLVNSDGSSTSQINMDEVAAKMDKHIKNKVFDIMSGSELGGMKSAGYTGPSSTIKADY